MFTFRRRPIESGPRKRPVSCVATEKKIKMLDVQILYRLLRTSQFAPHEGRGRCFLHPCNIYVINSNSACAKIAERFAAANKISFSALQMHYLMEVTWSVMSTFILKNHIFLRYLVISSVLAGCGSSASFWLALVPQK